MNDYLKKNINLIVGLFLLIGPVIDLITGLSLHILHVNFTLGIVLRVLFLFFLMYLSLFVYKNKKLLIPYSLILLYFIFYLAITFIYKNGYYFQEIQGFAKTFYFPVLFITLYTLKDDINISKMTLFTTFFLYLSFIFLPTIFNVGFKTYEITKAGTLGFFNSANEISGIISLLTPIMFYILITKKSKILTLITIAIYLPVILMMGTKTPLLTLIITTFFTIIYYWVKKIKQHSYKPIIMSFIIILLGVFSLLLIIPKTNFYKNIKTHLDYLEINNITEVFSSYKLFDHFIFSERLSFHHKKIALYKKAPLPQKMFGLGYYNNSKSLKMVEMDYFDIYYNHGLIGFLLFFAITLTTLYKILENKTTFNFKRYILLISFFLIIFLAFFTGHIITAPSVGLIAIIIILDLAPRSQKNLLFADFNMEIGGIEKAQLNLLKNINYDQYKVTLILEEKKGSLLKSIPQEVKVQELKVSNNHNVILRKILNFSRKLIFAIFNYDNYDFSCCYTTYSYSSNVVARLASFNNALYVHSNYEDVYDTKEEILTFFTTRKVAEFHKIIFVSNESKKSFLKLYPNYKDKTLVFNNFIDIDQIITNSKEQILVNAPKDKILFVFVGRLDDSSKKLSRAINLVKEIKNIELWIIGSGPDEDQYVDLTKKLNLTSRITFFGPKSNPYPYMQKANYIILTSDYEGFPVTYLEALVLHKDIITTINVSDDEINMKDYAYIVSKDEKQMVKEVKAILKKPSPKKKIDLKTIQAKRIKKLETLFK